MDDSNFEDVHRPPLQFSESSDTKKARLRPGSLADGSSQRRHQQSAANSQSLNSSQTTASLLPSPLSEDSHLRRHQVPSVDGQLHHCSQATAFFPRSPTLETRDQRQSPSCAVESDHVIDLTHDSDDSQAPRLDRRSSSPHKRTYEDFTEDLKHLRRGNQDSILTHDQNETIHLVDSQESAISASSLEIRRNAFNAMMGIALDQYEWLGLLSTTNNHTRPETELGEG